VVTRSTPDTRDRAECPAAVAAGTSASNPEASPEANPAVKTAQKAGIDTLYYDGRCPLCAGEIDKLRQTRGDGICLVDIHAVADGVGLASDHSPLSSPRPSPRSSPPPSSAPSRADSDGLSPARTSGENHAPGKDELLRTLHLQRADGSWLTGADANVAAWEGTAQERRLQALRWPVLRHIVDLGYALWARWRYWRLYGSQFDERRHAPDKTGH
jgi:predicted DCC family thiol-disulfide oxidoreductase YuxK